MAQVKLLKIDSNGLPKEMDTTADDVTLNSFTVDGGAVLSSTGLDMNNGNISDANDLSFTDPTTDGITNTSGTHAADSIMFEDEENSMSVGAAVLFPVITDVADSVDAFRLPALAGAPSASPSDGGEGYLVWDNANDKLYAWDGSAWDDLSTVQSAESVCNSYTATSITAIGNVVYIDGADSVDLADTSIEATSRIVGMASTAAAAAGAIEICSDGVVSGLSALTAGSRYFQNPAVAGAITTTVPTGSGESIVQIGYAKSATEMHLQLDFLGCRA